MIVRVVISDRGVRYLPGCLASYDTFVFGDVQTVFVDDSDHQLGMAGAVRQGWAEALELGADYVLHVEEDFEFTAPVQLSDLVYILDRTPTLAQVVLKRQPWNEAEKAAGGIIEANPGAYTQCAAMGRHLAWVVHHQIFSLNPTLIPRRVVELGWPDDNEAGFTRKCVDAGYQFAFYGGMYDPPLVQHVGTDRAVGWRL